MNKRFALVTYLIFTIFIGSATAQDDLKAAESKGTRRDTKMVDVVSIDGKAAKLKIIPDYVNKVLRVVFLKDTINISDYWGVPPKIEMLNEAFVKVSYEVRGGSNLGLGNTLILCIKGKKLIEAMHVLRYTTWDSGDDKSNYSIKLTLNGSARSNYSLAVSVRDYVYSKRNPEKNYTYSNSTILSFDPAKNVFYSIKESVFNQVAAAKGSKSIKQKVSGNFPVIILGKEIYYNINNRWYQAEANNEMNEI